MHDTAMAFGKLFFETYTAEAKGLKIVDVGSQDVTGSLKKVAPANSDYIGVDFIGGKGVDIMLDDPYTLPFADASVDVCVSSSCFEHAEFFWVLFEEIMRVLKPAGLLYLNAPSNGAFHRYPVDCWRFYPDSGVALQNWGRRQGINVTLLESFTGPQKWDVWNDFVAVFVKDDAEAGKHSNRMQARTKYDNGRVAGSDKVLHFAKWPEDQRRFRLKDVARRVARKLTGR